MDNVKNTMLINDWKQAGEELANGLKSYLQNSESTGFKALDSAKTIQEHLIVLAIPMGGVVIGT